jgi:hypothetical protein
MLVDKQEFSSNNGTAIAVSSPIDFIAGGFVASRTVGLLMKLAHRATMAAIGWTAGTNTGEAGYGKTSGVNPVALLSGDPSVGRTLSADERIMRGIMAVTTIGMGAAVGRGAGIKPGAATSELDTLTEEELSKVWGGGTARPLTDNQVNRAIELLRNGQDVHVESLGQMRQIQGELGQLGVRSESSSTIIPQRPAVSTVGRKTVDELPGSFRDGRGTYRVDPPHAPGTRPYHAHNEYPHINITLRNGKTLSIVVTGSRSF